MRGLIENLPLEALEVGIRHQPRMFASSDDSRPAALRTGAPSHTRRALDSPHGAFDRDAVR
jgi:hypothetical protein